jgi:hypothetical protein
MTLFSGSLQSLMFLAWSVNSYVWISTSVWHDKFMSVPFEAEVIQHSHRHPRQNSASILALPIIIPVLIL